MVTAHEHIERWGKGLGLRLPAEISKAVQLQVGQRVSISIEGRSIILTPCKPCEPSSISLADRLAQFDPVRHGGEIHLNTVLMQPIGQTRRQISRPHQNES